VERRIVRTIATKGLVWADQPVAEIVVREPTAGITLRLSELETRNQHAKRTEDVRDPFPILFEELTGQPAEILHLLPLSVGQEITEAIGEAMGIEEGKA